MQSQIFQGLWTQLTTLLELSERIDRLATGGRNGQRATLHTAADAPEGSLSSRVTAGCRAVGRFFGGQVIRIQGCYFGIWLLTTRASLLASLLPSF
jgi:hypothetical protein